MNSKKLFSVDIITIMQILAIFFGLILATTCHKNASEAEEEDEITDSHIETTSHNNRASHLATRNLKQGSKSLELWKEVAD